MNFNDDYDEEIRRLEEGMVNKDKKEFKLDKFQKFLIITSLCCTFTVAICLLIIQNSPKKKQCELWISPIQFSNVINSWRDGEKVYLTTSDGNIYVIRESEFTKKGCGEE